MIVFLAFILHTQNALKAHVIFLLLNTLCEHSLVVHVDVDYIEVSMIQLRRFSREDCLPVTSLTPTLILRK